MKQMKRIFSLFLAVAVAFSIYPNVVFAEVQEADCLEPTSKEMINELDEASRMLGEGLISEEEYAEMILDIYQLRDADSDLRANTRASASEYYPETQVGYINYEGVKYLYEEGLDKANGASALISLLISAIPGAGWGLSVIGVAAAYGGKSALEKAVNQAYAAKKGIKVYYQIHKSVQSMNRVRYVVG